MKVVGVGEIATQIRGVSYAKNEAESTERSGLVPILRAGNITEVGLSTTDLVFVPESRVTSRQLLRAGDVVVATSSGSINVVGKAASAQADMRCAFGAFCKVLRPSAEVDSRYFGHFFRTAGYRRRISALAAGANINNLRSGDLDNLQFPLPPVDEQRRIAAILDQADDLRANRRAAIAHLDSLTEAIFLDMFGDPSTNPRGWRTATFGSVCTTILGKMLDQKQQTGMHTKPYIRVANVRWHRFDLSDVALMDFDDRARQRYRLEPGDLMICEGGTEPGRAAVWAGELEECFFQKALHRGRVHPSEASPQYLARMLDLVARSGWLGDHIASATIAHLTGDRLRAMRIPVPPVETQLRFASMAERIESTRCLHLDDLTRLNSLFASLQARAFAGEL